MRDGKGRFIKGQRSSPGTEFKKGQHWRNRKPFWDKDWLDKEYAMKGRTALEIAEEFGIRDTAILYWLNKHGIKSRNVSETRKIKHWGSAGEKNPMWGKRGAQVPSWRGGCTPERQAFYSSLEWPTACVAVWKRDNATCQRCGKKAPQFKMNIHHIVSFSNKKLRAKVSNLVLLCIKCHRFVHSRKNTTKEFISE
jgi:hypothetical protein